MGPKIFIAEDHTLTTKGIVDLMERILGARHVGDCTAGEDVVPGVTRTGPDVLILDLGLSGRDGLEVVAEVRAHCPEVHVVVYSGQAEDEPIIRSLRAGAMAYVLKGDPPRELIDAVKAVMHRQRYLSSSVDPSLLALAEEEGADVVHRFDVLTPREKEVFMHVVQGRTSREVAAELGISKRTVDGHRRRIMQTLGADGLSDLIQAALHLGLLNTEASSDSGWSP